jgi:hypothetical protein
MKRSGLVVLALAIVLASVSGAALASGGGSGGGGGGGGGGKLATIRYTGLVTAMNPQPEGVYVQIGTSYYNTGLVLVNSSTNITVNGISNASISDVWLGDTVQVDATYTGIAVRLEATGLR